MKAHQLPSRDAQFVCGHGGILLHEKTPPAWPVRERRNTVALIAAELGQPTRESAAVKLGRVILDRSKRA